MPTTTRYGFRYAALGDTANGATLGQNLANDVDSALGTVQDSIPAFPFSTTLPSSPVDQQHVHWIDDTKGFSWPMVYRAAISAWVPVGIVPVLTTVMTEGTISPGGGSAWFDLSGTDVAGPSFTTPTGHTADWLVDFGAAIAAALDGNAARVGISIGGADPTSNNVAFNLNTRYAEIATSRKLTGVAGGTLLRLYYNSDGSVNTARYQRRWMKISPLKVT